MRIEITRIGILENELPPQERVDYRGAATLGGFLKYLVDEYGPNLSAALLEQDQLKPHIALLLNGQSVRALPEGIHSPIKDGDGIIISIMMDGG